MSITELGNYLANQQRDLNSIHGDLLTGSLITDYRSFDERVGVTFTIGVKQRWIGSAFYVVGAGEAGSRNGWVTPTGANNWVFDQPGDGMSAFGFIASGDNVK